MEKGEASDYIEGIKEFAKDELGMDLGYNWDFLGNDVSPVLYVSPKDEIRPCEDLQRKGELYFKLQSKAAAKRLASRFEEDGYATHITQPKANMNGGSEELLEESQPYLAAAVLHEAFHQYSSKEDFNLPVMLEEPLANYFGFHGSKKFFEENEPENVSEILDFIDRTEDFVKFVEKYYQKFEERGENSAEVFKAAEKEWEEGGFALPAPDMNTSYMVKEVAYALNGPNVKEVWDGVELQKYLSDPETLNKKLLDNYDEPPFFDLEGDIEKEIAKVLIEKADDDRSNMTNANEVMEEFENRSEEVGPQDVTLVFGKMKGKRLIDEYSYRQNKKLAFHRGRLNYRNLEKIGLNI